MAFQKPGIAEGCFAKGTALGHTAPKGGEPRDSPEPFARPPPLLAQEGSAAPPIERPGRRGSPPGGSPSRGEGVLERPERAPRILPSRRSRRAAIPLGGFQASKSGPDEARHTAVQNPASRAHLASLPGQPTPTAPSEPPASPGTSLPPWTSRALRPVLRRPTAAASVPPRPHGCPAQQARAGAKEGQPLEGPLARDWGGSGRGRRRSCVAGLGACSGRGLLRRPVAKRPRGQGAKAAGGCHGNSGANREAATEGSRRSEGQAGTCAPAAHSPARRSCAAAPTAARQHPSPPLPSQGGVRAGALHTLRSTPARLPPPAGAWRPPPRAPAKSSAAAVARRTPSFPPPPANRGACPCLGWGRRPGGCTGWRVGARLPGGCPAAGGGDEGARWAACLPACLPVGAPLTRAAGGAGLGVPRARVWRAGLGC